jgi:3-deoxy-manno-octulosonate cytidylyltransferase (CMP-KDO synthetase)
VRTVIIIPARFASHRYPGKPLVALIGKDGVSKPLVQRSWDCARQFCRSEDIYVATDDARIADCVNGFGGQVIMTSSDCQNGTERCAEAADKLEHPADLIINLQGDAPLTPPWFLSDLEAAMRNNPSFDMATPVLRCDAETYGMFRADRAAGRVGGTTAVFGTDRQALYFSKEVVPYLPDAPLPTPIPVFHHVGVYAYRPAALRAYASWPAGPLERNEGLEQLRFLERSVPVLCVEVEARGRLFWELNNPVDVARIEGVLP